jgi:hypothetical protein
MKIIYVLFLALLFKTNFYVFSQTEKKTLNEFLILGTLKDYMGRDLDPRQENLLDRYDPSEGVMKSIIDSLVKTTYPKKKYKDMEIGPTTISSNFLAKRFNEFYNYNRSGAFTPDGREVLVGKLKDNIMQNEQEKLAFLAGAFLRFGNIKDSVYCISISNSLSKAEVCNKLLKELGCKPSYNILRNLIPNGHVVYFNPTQKVLAYLKKYEKLHKTIEDSRKLFIQNMLNESIRKTKIE